MKHSSKTGHEHFLHFLAFLGQGIGP